ncbi:MAG: hypothetical protein NTX38_14665 [Methylobacter sp.]|nr:hypothetical protein [Methylobacter sp.]
MKSLLTFLFVLLSGCVTQSSAYLLNGRSTEYNRQLLVTFADKTIKHKLTVNTQEGYRSQNPYINSSWSQGFTHDLADRYHLKYLAQWPITSLGVSCVVYDVPKELQLKQVIEDLQKDPQVTLIQQMHNFEVHGNN